MRETRHPHPHIDPRQPRADARPGTNPPVFVWKPLDGQNQFRLTVARDAAFGDLVFDLTGLREPAYLPEKAFAPGVYYWKWAVGADESEVLAFEITPQAVTLEIPPVAEWLRRFPPAHPRLYIRPEQVAGLRASREQERAAMWRTLQAEADKLLLEAHELAEPPYLPDSRVDYQAFFEVWYRVLVESRRFVQGAETLALAYLASGERRYARAACQRMASVSRWEAAGSTHPEHNSEGHMSVIWHGATACDWVWDEFSAEERERVIAQFRARGRLTYEQVHDHGSYGVTRFDSHAGRKIVFLAQLALVFYEHIPEAKVWLEWLRPVLCGIWPIWAGDDGAWAEGPSYAQAYVEIMTMFATSLKRGAGIDLYRRPFWANFARWRRWVLPPYVEWIGFGDHAERSASAWLTNANLVELVDCESGLGESAGYVAAVRAEAAQISAPGEWASLAFLPQTFLAMWDRPPACPVAERDRPEACATMRVFPTAGWVALRTHLDDPQRDIAMIFRSSLFGAFSHAHANNNDFILHVGGKAMAMPSGYYDGYGSNHHANWVWHTKSHNCVTLSDAGQIMRSVESRGAIENAYEDERLAYWRGNADASYADRASRCRRHVLYLKPHACLLMIDEFVAAPGIASALQWNLHSWNRFQVDEAARSFLVEREGSLLAGHFLYHPNAFFLLTEGWDPPPLAVKPSDQWYMQYNLRFTASGYEARRNLAVLLCPGHAHLTPAAVRAERIGETEAAWIGETRILVNQGQGIEYAGERSAALALLTLDGRRYEVSESGIGLAH
jgi:hypothetical protein